MIKKRPSIHAGGEYLYFSNSKTTQKTTLWALLGKGTLMHGRGARNHRILLHYYANQGFENTYKFTIVRNPWDRMVSAFHHVRQGKNYPVIGLDENFKDFVKTRFRKRGVKIDPHFHHQHPNIMFEGKVFVDFIGRFENLEEDWKIIAAKIGCSPDLPHRNKGNHKPYKHYYDEECFEIVSQIYKDDIRLLGYTYEDVHNNDGP